MRVITLAIMCGLILTQGAKAETSPIVLACGGTITSAMVTDAKPEATNNVGVVVDPTKSTVSFNGYTVPIDKIDMTIVSFAGDTYSVYRGFKTPITVSGSIDRITGAMQATTMLFGRGDNKLISSDTWDLVCKPKNRMF